MVLQQCIQSCFQALTVNTNNTLLKWRNRSAGSNFDPLVFRLFSVFGTRFKLQKLSLFRYNSALLIIVGKIPTVNFCLSLYCINKKTLNLDLKQTTLITKYLFRDEIAYCVRYYGRTNEENL